MVFALVFLGCALALAAVARCAPREEIFLAGHAVVRGDPRPLIRGMAAACFIAALAFFIADAFEARSGADAAAAFPLPPSTAFAGRTAGRPGVAVYLFRTKEEPGAIADYYGSLAETRGWRLVASGGESARLLVFERPASRATLLVRKDTLAPDRTSMILTIEKR